MIKNIQYNRLINEINKFKSLNLKLNNGKIEILSFKNMELFIRFIYPKTHIMIPNVNYNCEKIINEYLNINNIINFTLYFDRKYPFTIPSIDIVKIDTYSNSLIKNKIIEFIEIRHKYWLCSPFIEKFLLAFYSHINIL